MYRVIERIEVAGLAAFPNLKRYLKGNCMTFIRKILLFTLLISPSIHAEECDTNTVARPLNIEKSTIKFEQLDKKAGEYVATLQNGDLVMASFLQCGLGLHAHLYSHRTLTGDQRAQTLKWFLAAVLPSPEIYKALENQIDASKGYEDNKTYTVSDDMESHDFEFKASESPLFKTAVHYSWQPPQH